MSDLATIPGCHSMTSGRLDSCSMQRLKTSSPLERGCYGIGVNHSRTDLGDGCQRRMRANQKTKSNSLYRENIPLCLHDDLVTSAHSKQRIPMIKGLQVSLEATLEDMPNTMLAWKEAGWQRFQPFAGGGCEVVVQTLNGDWECDATARVLQQVESRPVLQSALGAQPVEWSGKLVKVDSRTTVFGVFRLRLRT